MGIDERTDMLLRVNLLGPFKLEVNGLPVPVERWKSKKALTLLRLLLVKNGQRVPKDVLSEALWPGGEDFDEDSTHKLHSTVYMLRKSLNAASEGAGAVVMQSDGLYWADIEAGIWLDIVEFESCYRRGVELASSDAPKAVEHLRRAIELYRGDLLVEEVYQDWAASVREHYKEMYIDAVLRYARLCASLSEACGEAVAACRAALRVDPYREELYQGCLANLIKETRFAEASLLYRQCIRMLRDEFGLEPSPQTRVLYDQVKQTPTPAEREPDKGGLNPMEELELGVRPTGPFVCERVTFESIYKLELRRQERHGEPVTLLGVVLPKRGNTPVYRDKLLKVICNTLRQGDVVTLWDSGNVFAQLPRVGGHEADIVKTRVEKALLSADLDATVTTAIRLPSRREAEELSKGGEYVKVGTPKTR